MAVQDAFKEVSGGRDTQVNNVKLRFNTVEAPVF